MIANKTLGTCRILHTADNHIGISFGRYPESTQGRLIEERFTALERIVATANECEAHFLVVAGDLFDKQTELAQTWLQEEGFSEDWIIQLLSTNDSSINIAN